MSESQCFEAMPSMHHECACIHPTNAKKIYLECPSCGLQIELLKSDCDCKACKDTLYFVNHDNGNGDLCFGSQHGAKILLCK
jgi:hypothetical protein